ncbi:MAG: hypothetical protein RI992_852, partial [Actinomycetota bacterium]
MNKKLSRAFISVSDKTGLIEFAKKLLESGVEIIASDGTALELEKFGINVKRVEEITGFAQLLDGKVKTLHPLIYAAVLADLDDANQLAELEKHKITPIDLVVVNFYESKKFDIGGPAIVRAAIKNTKHVIALTSPKQYSEVIDNLEIGFTQIQRDNWARTALQMVTNYDLDLLRDFGSSLRYGENPHQSGQFKGNLERIFQKHQGKELSYNNLLDVDAALNLLNEFDASKACTFVIIKHNNACGVATRSTSLTAWNDALSCDPVSAFGGIIATNQPIMGDVAAEINNLFFEVLLAPGYDDAALELLKSKPNRIIIEVTNNPLSQEKQVRSILNGVLIQDKDSSTETRSQMQCVTKTEPTEQQLSA